jgi:hypothetical protein
MRLDPKLIRLEMELKTSSIRFGHTYLPGAAVFGHGESSGAGKLKGDGMND